MNTNLFLLANQGDTYAQSFFTKIKFNCKDKYLYLWVNIDYLYSISEYIRTFLFKHNEKSIDIEDYDSTIVRSCIEGLHKQDIINYHKIKVISLLHYLLIDPTIVIDAREIWNLVISNKDQTLSVIYNVKQNKARYNSTTDFEDDQSYLFELYIKANDKQRSSDFIENFCSLIKESKYNLLNVLLSTKSISDINNLFSEVYYFITTLVVNSGSISIYFNDISKQYLLKLIMISKNASYNDFYMNKMCTYIKEQHEKYAIKSNIYMASNLIYLIDELSQLNIF